MKTRTKKETRVNKIADIIGEGVHYGLRKWSEHPCADTAWSAIADIEDGSWEYICKEVARQVIKYLPKVPPHKSRMNKTRTKKETRVNKIADIIGEGVHYGLRKWSEHPCADTAWSAIADIEDGSWEYICKEVARQVIKYLPKVPPHKSRMNKTRTKKAWVQHHPKRGINWRYMMFSKPLNRKTEWPLTDYGIKYIPCTITYSLPKLPPHKSSKKVSR